MATDEVKEIKVEGPQTKWEAEKKDDEWWLTSPLQSLAEASQISNILYSLSSLKAKEFLSEEKNEEELRRYGLANPQYKIKLQLPQKEQELTVYLTKQDDTLYATSTATSKIISAEDTITSDLDKKIEELREKEIAVFYTWEVKGLKLKTKELDISLQKNDANDWLFEPSGKKADNEKIENFIREVESLETDSFIDPPFELKEYGLEQPQTEFTLLVEEGENKTKEITIQVGQIQEKDGEKTAYLRNTRLNYLFQVKADFLEKLPPQKEDWQPKSSSASGEKEGEK